MRRGGDKLHVAANATNEWRFRNFAIRFVLDRTLNFWGHEKVGVYTLVKGENAESWKFFLSHLRRHVTPQPGIFVLSDRNNGINAALEDLEGGGCGRVHIEVLCAPCRCQFCIAVQ
ncbi:hypothetical protein PIB30_091086 [Stylosanthes scabra]|uniref:MULE transposase domain-containing protein n=1 Tax=Stylosanthes scabra TaxID=79078 RepID=A0ABU6SV40_9FABA|nr:hypothetical protein [Stylosanthes scabra]